MTEGAQKRLGFSAIGGRKAKAEKIRAILAAAGRPLKSNDRILDVGCGSGEVAAALAEFAQVVCVDVVDQRVAGRQLPFHSATHPLPFADATFDVVVSNHVIEHTRDPDAHCRELQRLLRPGGVGYLATPNRWWPWEFHTRLPLLHYLPRSSYNRIASRLGVLDEPLRLVSLRNLKRMATDRLTTEVWHPKLLHDPRRFSLTLPAPLAWLLRRVPQALLQASAALQPTLILLYRRT